MGAGSGYKSREEKSSRRENSDPIGDVWLRHFPVLHSSIVPSLHFGQRCLRTSLTVFTRDDEQ